VTLPHLNLTARAAIAFSGGGDSTAMVHAFRDQPLVTHAFIIDHNLRAGSAAEVEQAADFARSLGYAVKTDVWQHSGIKTGIQVKARQYRYSSLGRLCRESGLTELITAHTADDQAETLLMRIDRQTGWRGLAGMPVAAYAPLWPALAGVTLHRPWLDVSRAELREYNRNEGLPFVDDPSNENRDFTRVRARQALSGDRDLRADLLKQQAEARLRLMKERVDHSCWLSEHAQVSPHGFIETDAVPPPELLLHMLNAVSGQGGPIDAAKRRRLHDEMNSSTFKAATLAGSWIAKTARGFVITRDMVAVSGRRGTEGLIPRTLKSGDKMLWDGRYWLFAKQSGIQVEPTFGRLGNLQQHPVLQSIFELPSKVRPSLPLYADAGGVLGYGAMECGFVSAQATTASRLQAIYPKAIPVPL
jgi:tRNA(Ile)-lysidine synthase